MDKNLFIKFSLIIFVILSIVISLFPPFEFGNEKLKTLSERKVNSKIIDKLPIKDYDFIFRNNKKYFVLGSYNFFKLIKLNDLETYREKWRDKEFNLINKVDSFFTPEYFLYPLFLKTHYKNGVRKINEHPNIKKYGLVAKAIMDIPKNWYIKNNINSYDWDFIRSAINYWDVKNEYEMEPNYWDTMRCYHLDSVANYGVYRIKQPRYYLLNRNLLSGELIVEFILALFLSTSISYIIYKFKAKKLSKT